MSMFTRVTRVWLVAMAMSLLGGCGDGPDGQALQRLLEHRLANEGRDWGLSLNSLQRRGQQAYQFEDSAAKGLVVYYKATLGLARPLRSTATTPEAGHSLQCLARMLGATPTGVEGLVKETAEGGEPVPVYGALVFAWRDGQWQPVAPEGESCRQGILAVDSAGALG